MASSNDLADAVADALGLSRQTVRHHLRNLRDGDLISYKGQGRHAAAMKPLDAARLTIAAAGSLLVKDSLATCRGFGSLPRAQHEPDPAPAAGDFDDEVAGATTLEDFLTLRIKRLLHGYPFRRDRERDRAPRPTDRLANAALDLSGSVGPGSSNTPVFAVVRWWSPTGRGEQALFARPPASGQHPADFFLQNPGTGMLVAKHVGARAFESIARSLRGEAASDPGGSDGESPRLG